MKIGVLAFRGPEHAMEMWKPTADYLTSKITGHAFSIVPLGFHEINSSVSKGEVDFVLANSSIYVELETLYDINRIATMKKKADTGTGYTILFGGVIFTRSDRNDINSFKDLKGKSLIAVDETSLGGWRVAWRQMKEQGVDPYRDLSSLSFSGTHDDAVFAVRDGKADAGTIRTDILESLHKLKRIDLKDFRILNRQTNRDFPFELSTKLYPEWPFAKSKHTSNDLAQKVAVALMTMSPESEAAKRAEITGWTIPLDYGPVHELLRELRLPPYAEEGKITLKQAVRQYWNVVAIGMLLLLVAVSTAVYVMKLNAGLRHAKGEIEAAHLDLEKKVDERTAELRSINMELEQEIVSRRQAEEALRESERQFRETLEGANLIALQLDMDGRITFANEYLAQLTNWDLHDITGRIWFDIFIPENRRDSMFRLHRQNTSGEIVGEYVSEIMTRHGGRLLISWTNSRMMDAAGNIIGLTSLGMDITQKRQIDEIILNNQKLEAVGTLAGGIAHDFNNMLQGIFGFIAMAKLSSDRKSKAYDFLDQAEASLGIATNLTSQLLTFAKGGKPVKKIFAIEEVIRNAARLALSGSRCSHRFLFDDNLWNVEADAGQIGQVIQNIVINADDAMPEGGIVTISAGNVIHRLPHSTAAEFVKIAIEDTGGGIPDENLKRIFDPYFTTKKKGSGLGLATAYSIIRNHDGMIDVESGSGKGTKFIIYLPAAQASEVDEIPAVVNSAPGDNKGKILVMDDEEMVQTLLKEMLRTLGHDPEIVRDGEEAIARYEGAMKQGRKFDVVILDLTIRGGMGGAETNRRLHEIDPEVKTIISSGYSDDTTISKYSDLGFKGYLKKPYNLADLRKMLASLL